MKKALSVFLTAVLVLSLILSLAVPSFAAGQTSLVVSKQTSGSTMTVTVELTPDSNLCGMCVVLRYDAAELEYVSGSFKSGGLFGIEELPDSDPGKLVYTSVQTDAITSGGTLVSAKFKVLDAAAKVTVECTDALDDNDIQVEDTINIINAFDGENAMYRLYNPNSGEHFYTSNVGERNNLISLGWNYEGVGWTAPSKSSTPVYRLYNKNGGEHHYTASVTERDRLVSLGWNYEGIGWNSDDAQGVPIYRQYNPNAFANNHNYTASKTENDRLVSYGWRYEGIGWYGVA